MICPFCQQELEENSLACTRCHAFYPQPAKPFGFNLRLVVAAGSMMLVLSVTLVDCVINWLPGGHSSLMASGSPQLPTQPKPDLKSPDVDKLILGWKQGQQDGGSAQPVKHR
jgi:hypothetical protein